MAKDEMLLRSLDSGGVPILHLYSWKSPALTYGCLVNPADYLRLDALSADGIDLAIRPTGGGIIFHLFDYAFSLLIPQKSPFFPQTLLDGYRTINTVAFQALKKSLHRGEGELFEEDALWEKAAAGERFCMARPTRYDVMIGGKKCIGAAQRRGKGGLLHQGSISLLEPFFEDLQRWTLSVELIEWMKHYAFWHLPSSEKEKLSSLRSEVKENLLLAMRDFFMIN